MLQAGDSARLFEKILHVIVGQPHVKHFDSGLGLEVYVFAEINISETTPTQQVHQVVVSKLLTSTRPGGIAFPVFQLRAPLSYFTLHARHVPLYHSRPKR